MEPDRSLSTSSEGLSATTEIEAPFFINYGSRTLLGSRTWQGKLSARFFPKSEALWAAPTVNQLVVSSADFAKISSKNLREALLFPKIFGDIALDLARIAAQVDFGLEMTGASFPMPTVPQL